ncbi:hypothetical protein ACEPOF_000407 [Acinetobacter baumannii]
MCLGCFIEDIKKSGLGEVVVLEMTKDGLRPIINPSAETKAAVDQHNNISNAAGSSFKVDDVASEGAVGMGAKISSLVTDKITTTLGKVTQAEGKISNRGAGHSILTTPLPPKANFVALGGNTIKATNINTLDQAYTASEKMHRFVVPNLDELLLRTQASVGVLSGLSVHLNNGDEGKYSEEQYVKELIKLTALNFMSLQERGVALEDVVKAVTQTFEEMGTQTLRDEMTNFLKERGFATDVKAG